jgi:hypothetical protein
MCRNLEDECLGKEGGEVRKIYIEESEVAGKAETYKKSMWEPLTLQWNNSRNDALNKTIRISKGEIEVSEILFRGRQMKIDNDLMDGDEYI